MHDPNEYPYIPRDLSWLSFNDRVLQEAKDPNVPLLERMKFLAIYSSNLDEFYRVRVAQHRNLIRLGKKAKKELEYKPKLLLREVQKAVNLQQLEFSRILETQIIPELKNYNIFLARRLDLTKDQEAFVESYFRDNMLPFVQPVLLVKNKIRVFLNNAALYLSIILQPKDSYTAHHEYAIIKIPSDYLPRFIEIPSNHGRHELILLDDIVRHSVSWLFPGYDIVDTYSIKLTRDAELYIDDEFSGNLIQKIKTSLQKRNVGPAARFVYDREMPQKFLDFLGETFSLEKVDMLPEGRYHNNFDFFKFPDFGLNSIKYKTLTPIPYKSLEQVDNIFTAISAKDHLINTPYHSYESVIRFFEDAAEDPKVTHIKVVQYRVAKKSRIMRALVAAVKAGKQVSVFIEVKARFDEEANIRWGEMLQEAGVTVHYSMPGVKVHSKLALVSRRENKVSRLYAYLSTGNFNEDTAKVYTDFSMFTIDERITNEMARVFNYLESGVREGIKFDHLLVGQFNLREGLLDKIDREIAFAKEGKKANIILKLNSLEDEVMIESLYKASRAGVKVQIIVRGVCCLIPGVKKFSENIQAISIVDRFLEHARVFIFHNDGNEEIYLSSADWMLRNLSHRIETAFPIYDKHLKQTIKDVIQIQLEDNVKARIINATNTNQYQKDAKDELDLRSQVETYYYYKQKTEPENNTHSFKSTAVSV